MAKDSHAARSLRSKNNVKDHEAGKFNFDIEEFDISPSKNLKVVSLGRSQRKFTTRQLENLEGKCAAGGDTLWDLEEKSQKISSMILDIRKHELNPLDPAACDDMLPDSLYSTFHKQMLKQENRMLEMDLVEGEAEAERLQLLRDKLDMMHWPITLRKVTVVNDPNDEAEILNKRELTKQCIDSMLEKFEAMKTKSNMLSRNNKRNRIDPSRDLPELYSRVDRRQVIDYHSSSDEEEEHLSAEQIKIHRRKKRQEQCRGSIVVHLTLNSQSPQTKYAIIAEPLRKPYVAKVSQAERRLWKNKMSSAPKKFKTCQRLADQTAVFRRKVSIPLTLAAADQAPANVSDIQNMHRGLKRKALSVCDNLSNGLDVVDEKLLKFQGRIHSPPIHKKRKKQE